MKATQQSLLGAALLALTALPSCVINVPDQQNAHHTSYNSPARVTKLNNGNYLVSIDGKILSFNSKGHPISTGTATSSQVYHAREAVNDYIRGHRGDHMHPNYTYQSSRPPEVRPRGDGKLEVRMPKGGVILYDANGRMIQKGGSVSGSELYDANKAVQSYIRENNSSRGYSGV
jgi:hypothetical protein